MTRGSVRNVGIHCLALVTLLAACGGSDQDASSADAASGDATAGATLAMQTPPAGSGTITGAVKFDGPAPANPAIDMSDEAACKDRYASSPTDPQVVVRGGMLANAFVYVKSGLPAGQTFQAPAAPVVIDQDGCLYTPRVLGVMVGQKLEIRNSDPVLHNIKAVPQANRGFNISQPTKGMATTRTFGTREVMVPLECNVHGWMNAYVGVLDHPFFAVSDSTGAFRIGGLPAGTYQVEAWHEKLGTRTMEVTVPEGGTAPAEFTFAPTRA